MKKQAEAPETGEMTPRQKQESKRRHRRKARVRMIRRLLLVVLIVTAFVLIYNHWDTLAPDKLLVRFQDSMTDNGGGFPVDVAETNTATIQTAGNYFVTLSDSYVVFYNSEGAEAKRYGCAYPTPLITHAGKYVLVAEQGGKRLQLLTRSLCLVDTSVAADIVAVSVNEKGQYAVITQGEQNYSVTVTVYNRRGEALYSRSRNVMSAGVSLSPDGKRVALLTYNATDGTLSGKAEVFTVDNTQDAVASFSADNTLLYSLFFMDNTHVAVAGEDGVTILDVKDNTQTAVANPNTRLLACMGGDGGMALVVRPYGDNGGGEVVLVNTKGTERCRVPFQGEFRHFSGEGQRYVLLTDAYAMRINAAGLDASVQVATDGQQVALSGNRAVVLGLSQINAYSF